MPEAFFMRDVSYQLVGAQLNEYVKRWDRDGILEGNPDRASSRELSSYNEKKAGKVGADMIAAQYIGNLDYSRIPDLNKHASACIRQ